MKREIFESGAFEDFTGWAAQDKKLYARIVEIIPEIEKSPFTGLGKPEPLRHELKGYRSRRINDVHCKPRRVPIDLVRCRPIRSGLTIS